MSTLSLEIGGMSCGHCVRAVENALKHVDGVAVQNVAIGSATLEFDPAKTSAELIAKLVEAEGYAVLAAR
jgi:copper chaperone CopZ